MRETSVRAGGAVPLPASVSVADAWRELKRRAASKVEDQLPPESRKEAQEKSIALYGEPNPALAGMSQHEIYEKVLGAQLREYGVDRRYDLFEIPALPPEKLSALHLGEDDKTRVLQVAAAVALLVHEDELEPLPAGGFKLLTRPFGPTMKLCKKEQFEDQPIVGFCSGVLVGPDLVATAGHCARSEIQLRTTRFVFGYRMLASDSISVEVSASQVYEAESFVGGPVEDPLTGSDWALVKLKRKVVHQIDGREVTPVPLRRRAPGDEIPREARVYVIGHPCGLPCKLAGGAKVKDSSQGAFFKANLDTFGGNSGSPVLGADHLLEGLLVRGQPDFTEVPCDKEADGRWQWCVRSLIYPVVSAGEIDDKGEDCARVTEFAHQVPDSARGK